MIRRTVTAVLILAATLGLSAGLYHVYPPAFTGVIPHETVLINGQRVVTGFGIFPFGLMLTVGGVGLSMSVWLAGTNGRVQRRVDA